ncbi:MAG: aminotransferase class I/II-fold pyridoxal phosphate-dependent enzyme [Tissierellia bacterium]|nr:aminotransferase class I/II-fold pyridoxal phosphate-dependent enzyme [Tissierellia bacterium]
MNTFVNDYNDLCHPRVLEALRALEEDKTPGYGYDAWVEGARKRIQEVLDSHSLIYLLPGATACNMLGLTFPLRPHEAILSPASGHIVNDEVGAIQAKGHRVINLEEVDGKIKAGDLDKSLASFGDFHNVLPGMVYVSQSTEKGTIYQLDELRAIYDVCQDHGVYLYIDGARLGSALYSWDSDMTWKDLARVCDIFSIGGTKNGAMFGDALVFNDPKLGDKFNYYLKQQGALMAKSFLLGAQFEVLFRDGLYDEIATQANRQAKKLSDGLKDLGVDFYATPQSNQIFIKVPTKDLEDLAKKNWFEIIEEVGEDTAIRFVTTYRTQDQEVQGLLEDLKGLASF